MDLYYLQIFLFMDILIKINWEYQEGLSKDHHIFIDLEHKIEHIV